MSDKINTKQLQSKGRRRACKTLAGGLTAVAAYNFLPAKWGTPILESIVLPVHAATSGCCDATGSFTTNALNGGDTVSIQYTQCTGGVQTTVFTVGDAEPFTFSDVDTSQTVSVTSSNALSPIDNENNISFTGFTGTITTCADFSFQVNGVT